MHNNLTSLNYFVIIHPHFIKVSVKIIFSPYDIPMNLQWCYLFNLYPAPQTVREVSYLQQYCSYIHLS